MTPDRKILPPLITETIPLISELNSHNRPTVLVWLTGLDMSTTLHTVRRSTCADPRHGERFDVDLDTILARYISHSSSRNAQVLPENLHRNHPPNNGPQQGLADSSFWYKVTIVADRWFQLLVHSQYWVYQWEWLGIEIEVCFRSSF